MLNNSSVVFHHLEYFTVASNHYNRAQVIPLSSSEQKLLLVAVAMQGLE